MKGLIPVCLTKIGWCGQWSAPIPWSVTKKPC